MKYQSSIYVVAASRTPIGRFQGALAGQPATDLGVCVSEAVLSEDRKADCGLVVAGQVLQAGCGMNPARQVGLRCGLDLSIPAYTVNTVCGSGLQAVATAADAVALGQVSAALAIGMESMSQAPYYLPELRRGKKFGDGALVDAVMRDGLTDPLLGISMGETAERIAESRRISRAEQDAFALRSQERAAAAVESYAEEIVAVSGKTGLVSQDEHPRPDTTLDQLAALRPAFRSEGTVTAGNASGLNDGAAAIYLAGAQAAQEHRWPRLARIVGWAICGCEPETMGLGPVGATQQLCRELSWSLKSVDCFEINEAFAAQVIACVRELKLPEDKVNPRGGAIALGHPIGCSGARLLVSLVHFLRTSGGRRGIATLCIGGGMGVAMAVETGQD